MQYFPGSYPEPYLLVRTTTGIVATDLVTHDTKIVVRWEKTYEYGMDVDMKGKKLYFSNQRRIYKSNLDGTRNETILKNASANDIAIEWKGSRVLRNDYAGKEIYATNFDGKDDTILIESENNYVMHIAVDSNEG